MYSGSQGSLFQPRFNPFSSLVQTLGEFRSAVLPNTST